jgi:hypothetical protein
MSKQANDFSRRKIAGMITGFMQGRRLLAGVATVLMATSLIFTGGASAHNISLAKGEEVARDYAQSVRRESNGKYRSYTTDCYTLFQGHNHYVRCVIKYTDKERAGLYTPGLCQETIDVFYLAHSKASGRTSWSLKHHSGQCGSRKYPGI